MGLFRLVVALAGIAAALLAPPAFAGCKLAGGLELPVTTVDGNPMVAAKINGVEVHLILDTGAFYSALTPAAATKLGLPITDRHIDLRERGVGGQTGRVPMRLAHTFTLGGTDFYNVAFNVSEKSFGHADGLLGENFLLDETVEYDLSKGVIRFFQSEGCPTEPLAYWATTQPISVIDIDTIPLGAGGLITALASVNGEKVKAIFDTGAPRSIMTLNAAARAGVRPFDPGVYLSGSTSGVALHSDIQTWNAPLASFKLGDEEIRNTRLFIGPLQTDGFAEMIIGADFFKSHRLIVSHEQHKIYFTFSGGRVFAAGFPSEAAQAADSAAGPPVDAQGFGRRGWAEFGRKDYDAAVADLTKAITLAPMNATYVYQRGEVYFAEHKPQQAMADFDQSLKLGPDGIWVLLERAKLHRAINEVEAANTDIDTAAERATNKVSWGLAIGQAYSAADRYEKSIKWLDLWIAGNPGDQRMADALNSRCWSRALLGRDLVKALADCDASLKLIPEDPSTLDSRGLVRLRLRDFDGSISDYNAAIAAHPNVAWSYYGRALAEENKGMMSEGEEDERRAKRLSPDIAATAAKYGVTPPSL